jgi:hypothetical protein
MEQRKSGTAFAQTSVILAQELAIPAQECPNLAQDYQPPREFLLCEALKRRHILTYPILV